MACLRQRLLNSCLSFGFLLLLSYNVFAVTARVSGDNVNVRVRPDKYSEIVAQLKSGEEVIVLEKGDEWTKINAPGNSNCWVHKDYVTDDVITGDSVNLRCGPGASFPVLVQVDRDTKIIVLETVGDWLRIKPPVDFNVWVSSEYLKYPAEEKVEQAPVIPEETIEGEIFVDENEQADKTEKIEISSWDKDMPAAVSVKQKEIVSSELVSYAGNLMDLGRIINRPGTYKLVSERKWICILRSSAMDLNPYVNRFVRIEGVMVTYSDTWDVPIIEVKRLQVIK